MIKVTVKYRGKPAKLNEEKTEVIKYVKNYTIDEYVKAKDYYNNPQQTIKKEVTKIFKKYKGIYCIKFYVHD